MLDPLPIPVVASPVEGRVRPPGSKSITNRALVCAALARGPSTLRAVLDSQDTRVMVAGLASLGFEIHADWLARTVRIKGGEGRVPAATASIDCAASGTTMRFLSAVCGLGEGPYRLDGTPRMRKRPIGDLVESLVVLGCSASAESEGGCPPVVVSGGIIEREVAVRGATSSQFASALAMIGPCLRDGLKLSFEGVCVSMPYLEMTRRVMESFGASLRLASDGTWFIAPGCYDGRDYDIEPDASAASYFFAAAAITGGRVTVEGLAKQSLQGDVAFCAVLERMGCTVTWGSDSITVSGRATRGIDVDMNAISDTVPTLGVVALFADGSTRIGNVSHIRDKETDRLADLARELRRLGADVEERFDGLTIHPRSLSGAVMSTYDDHRMAMSLALAGLVIPDVSIADPGCVAKTFPDYWRTIGSLVGKPELSS
ncbi:MAG: 3-phosphoshikimate 1-carboxyvinyltransferase [Planctomycetaceae bacterium]